MFVGVVWRGCCHWRTITVAYF